MGGKASAEIQFQPVAVRFLVSVAIAACPGEDAAFDAPGPYSLEHVIQRVEANEKKLSLIRMDFSAEFTFEGEPPQYLHDPRVGERRSEGRRCSFQVEWAQDQVRRRFFHEPITEGGDGRSEITVVDGETSKSADWPEFRRGVIGEASRYSRWMADYAWLFFYRPYYNPSYGYPLLSEFLRAGRVVSDVAVQKVGGREAFVVDVRCPWHINRYRYAYRRLYIDTQRGLLLRSESYSDPPDGAPPAVNGSIELTAVYETANSGWVGVAGPETHYGPNYRQFIDLRVDVNSISVDRQDIPDSLFELEFPEQTNVFDWSVGTWSKGNT